MDTISINSINVSKRSDVTALIVSIEKINDITKIIKSYEETGSLIKGVIETIQNESKKQKWISWYVIRYTSCYLLGNILTGKGVKKSKKKAGQGLIRAKK